MNCNKHQTEKENFKIHVEKESYKLSVSRDSDHRLSSGHSAGRNPLSTVSDNVPLSRNIRSRTTYNRRVDINKKQFRTNSTDGVVTRLEYDEIREKVTTATVQTTNVCKEAVKAPTERTSDNKPARKITLARKLSKRYINTQELLGNCLYGAEYFTDNYQYMVGIERKGVLRRKCLVERVNRDHRLLTVNWSIQVQQALNLSQGTLFTAIRMIDNFLYEVETSTDHYYLVGITCIWISSKMHEMHFILASRLSALCNGKYSKGEVAAMERKILTTLHFNVNFMEPTTFLFYYLISSDMEKDVKVLFGASFLLEIFSYVIEFSSSTSSILAAAALYLTLQRYNIDSDPFLQSHFADVARFLEFAKYMNYCVKQVLSLKNLENEAVRKYSAQAKLNVAQYFITD